MLSSVLTGEWSMMATVNMLDQFHSPFKLRQRFITIQLIMPCVKVQAVVANEILKSMNITEPMPLVIMNGKPSTGGRAKSTELYNV